MEERIVKRVEEMVATLHNQFQNSHSGAGSSKNNGAKTYASRTDSRFVAQKLAKLDFPWYDGLEDQLVGYGEQFFNLKKRIRGRKITIDSLSSRRRSPIMVPVIQGE
jgi:exopolysaccharide biosynthesis predicted pyruvyltransferase EpsI